MKIRKNKKEKLASFNIFDFNKYNNGSSTRNVHDSTENNSHILDGFKGYSSDQEEDNPIQADSDFLFI